MIMSAADLFHREKPMKIHTRLVVICLAVLVFLEMPAEHSQADQKRTPNFTPWEYKVISLDGDAIERAKKLKEFTDQGWKVVGPIENGKVKLRRPPFGPASGHLTADQIKSLFENSKQNPLAKIDGSDNDDHQIPIGTILLYVTDENRYGYLEILEYGYNLTIKWVTFDKAGKIFAKGDKLLIKGTWLYDLDYGIEGPNGKSRVDFWWEQVDRTRRFVVPKSGAKFLIHESKN
jgi:hypothetical protein